MVSILSILAMLVTLFITLIVPILIPIVYGIRHKGKGVWPAWLLGAAGFFVLQVIIRLPIVSVFSSLPFFAEFVETYYVPYCLILAFTAALFEVIARFLVAKILQRKNNPEKSLAAGFGHGGIEAIILIGMTYINNLVISLMINFKLYDLLMKQQSAAGMPPEALQQLLTAKYQLIETESYLFLLAGYERILTIAFHAALSLLVCYMVYKKRAWIGVIIAFVAHFLVDFISPLINGMATGYLGNLISQDMAYVIVYTFLSFVGILSVLLIVVLIRKWRKEESEVVMHDKAA